MAMSPIDALNHRMLNELLAIKLYEHDHGEWPVKDTQPGWNKLSDEDKNLYRELARDL